MIDATTFKPGDVVQFDETCKHYHLTKYHAWVSSDQMYTIARVVEITDPIERLAAGHHQHVDLVEDPKREPFNPNWSGVFFKLAVTPQRH